jgi:hypothetical protein
VAVLKDWLLYSTLAEHCLLRPLVRLGYWQFRRSGRTPGASYSSFRKLHCVTGGEINRELSLEISRRVPLLELGDEPSGALGRGGRVVQVVDRAIEALRRDGFYVFPERLDAATCAELVKLAEEAPAILVPAPRGLPRVAKFNPADPRAPRYQLDEATLLRSPAVRRLLGDASLIYLGQRYLEAPPINDLVTMWWSAPQGPASSEAAQLFHFDMDRIRFLKVFVYLTDVDADTGPHVYVRGSHRSRPRAFFRDRRFSDREVAEAFPADDICELVAPAGTMIAADTSGLHKGKALARGQRLLFQLELTNSLFGQTYEEHRWQGDDDDPLAAAIRRYPVVLQRFGRVSQ